MEHIEFIDCNSLSISYDVLGVATVSFNVVSNEGFLVNDYTSFMIGDAIYNGYITSVYARPIPFTSWWEFAISLVMTSER